MSEFDGEWTKRKPDGWVTSSGKNNPSPDEAEPQRQRLLDNMGNRRLVAGIATLALGGVAIYGGVRSGKDTVKSIKPERAPAPLAASCPQPSDKDISTVERLFSEPVAKARAEYRKLPLIGYYAEALDILAPSLVGASVPAILYNAEDYFNKYGVDIEAASAPEQIIDGMRSPTTEELESGDASNNVVGMIEALAEMPPHYVLESGLKKIRLVAGRNNTEFAWEEPHTLIWNIDTPQPTPDGVPFELGIALGHFTEDRMCGPEGVDTDSAFQSINNGPFASTLAPHDSIYGGEGQIAQHTATLNEYHDGKAKTNDVKIIDERATESLSTDKAEILALIAEPTMIWSAMSSDHPTLRAKVIETLAELYRTQPAVVRRLAVKAAQYPWNRKTGQKETPAGNHHDQVFKVTTF